MKHNIHIFFLTLMFAQIGLSQVDSATTNLSNHGFLLDDGSLLATNDNPSQIIKAENIFTYISTLDLRKEISNLSENPSEKSNEQILVKSSELVEIVSVFLRMNKVNYKIVEEKNMLTDFFGFKWKYIQILTTGSNKLNIFSKGLKINLDVKLVYDPVALALMGFGGAYIDDLQTLYLSGSSIFAITPISYIEMHESIHAKYAACRRGYKKNCNSDPINVVFDSEKPINPDSKIKVYQTFMSFEEMVTFSYNILAYAKIANSKDNKISAQRKMFAIEKLKSEIDKLVDISTNTILAVKKAEEIIRLDSFVLECKKEIVIKENNGFKLIVSNAADIPCNKNSILNELNKAVALANFNITFFQGISDLELIQKSLKFRGEQRFFLSR